MSESGEEVRSRLHRYFEAVDRHDAEGVVSVLSGAVVDFRGERLQGDVLEHRYRELLSGPEQTAHILGNLVCDHEGDTVAYRGLYQRVRLDQTPRLEAVGGCSGTFIADRAGALRWVEHRVGQYPLGRDR